MLIILPAEAYIADGLFCLLTKLFMEFEFLVLFTTLILFLLYYSNSCQLTHSPGVLSEIKSKYLNIS